MRVIFFIGHHKVGSSSLQDFLSRNSVALARAGILYPSVDFEGMALMLATAIGRYEPPDALPVNAREPHNALAFKLLARKSKGKVPKFHTGLPSNNQMLRAIKKQIEFLKPDTVILAAEVFARFAQTSPELITLLIKAFPGADFTVIATLRRIDTYLASWHGQRLKFGHDIAPLRAGGLKGYLAKIHFDYRLMLGGWIDAQPDARFILRDYSQVEANGGSVADFIAQSGLELPPGLLAEQRMNRSFHRGVYEIARLGNKALRPPQIKELRRFLRRVTPELGLPTSDDIELFGTENRQLIADRFEPIHTFLGKVTGSPPFFPDQDEVRKTLPIPEMDAARHTLAGILRHTSELDDPSIGNFLASLSTNLKDRAGR